MTKDWVEYKKTYTQEQEDAMWQYFLDHSKRQPNGFFGIMFYIRNMDDFWRRLHFRATGEFQRYSKEEKMNNAMYENYRIQKRMMDDMAFRYNKIDKTGSPFEKLCLFLYRKTRDYIKK